MITVLRTQDWLSQVPSSTPIIQPAVPPTAGWIHPSLLEQADSFFVPIPEEVIQ